MNEEHKDTIKELELDNIKLLLQIYDQIHKKDKFPNRYISPVEIIIRKIETDTNTKSFVRMGLTEKDLSDLRRLPMLYIGRGYEPLPVHTVEQNKAWIMNYIRRKRPDLYEGIVVFDRKVDGENMIFIITKDIEVPERHIPRK